MMMMICFVNATTTANHILLLLIALCRIKHKLECNFACNIPLHKGWRVSSWYL